MTQTLAEGAFSREARMVLRLIDKPDTRLVEAGSGEWEIESGKARGRSRLTVEDATVGELVGRGWLIREPTGSCRISVAGERWLADASAGTEDGFGDQHRLVRRSGPSQGRRHSRGASGPAINEAESPLGWLRSRRDKEGQPLISEAQYNAGERLRVDFTVAQMSPKVTLSWDGCIAPGSRGRSGRRPDSLEVNERSLAAKQRFMRALDAVGPEMSGILVDVCCLARGLEAAERSLGWPQRSGKLVLQIALTQLARHYGMVRAEPDARRPAFIRHWGADDYRPQVGVAPGNAAGDGDQA
jgi:hypothetical protein